MPEMLPLLLALLSNKYHTELAKLWMSQAQVWANKLGKNIGECVLGFRQFVPVFDEHERAHANEHEDQAPT